MNSNYEKEYQDKINFLKEKYYRYKSEYYVFLKTNAYDMYDLYVELPITHPYLTQEFPDIKSDFFIRDKFSKYYPTRAKCQFCKSISYKGEKSEALEYLDLFSSALQKIEEEQYN